MAGKKGKKKEVSPKSRALARGRLGRTSSFETKASGG
jgi:hypothetical protein